MHPLDCPESPLHGSAPSAEAAVTAQTDTLRQDGSSVDEAVHIALLNNRGFQSQFRAIGVSRADFVPSSLLSNPTLKFSARMLDVGGRANVSFGLAQELADLRQIPVRKRIAKSTLERTIPGALVIPVSAIANHDGKSVVTLIRDERAHEAEVETGLATGDRIQQLSGIEVGDIVATSGGYALPDDSHVHATLQGDES